MAKRWIWIPVVALAAALVGACLYAMFRSPAPPSNAPAYTLRTQAGQVVLYRANESAPIAYYEVYTALLPDEDALALSQGISVQTRAEALQLLEDFGL